MAVVKVAIPLDKLHGTLGKKDRTVGREPGLTINIIATRRIIILAVKTTPTATRSPGQKQRSKIYCYCDEFWKEISPQKRDYLLIYHTKIRNKSPLNITHYLCWMSLCMSNDWDNELFLNHSFVTRYRIKNDSDTQWTDKLIILKSIIINTETGTDITVLQTNYYHLPIQYLNFEINTPGEATVSIPNLSPEETIYIDVYSYEP